MGGTGILDNIQFKDLLKGKQKQFPLKADASGVGRIEVQKSDPALPLQTNPVMVKVDNETDNIYWGDMHVHTLLSDGNNTPEYALQYARNIDHADFCALADHVEEMTRDDWLKCVECINAFNDDHRFVTLLGYEMAQGGSHRNIYFNTDTGPFIRNAYYKKFFYERELQQYSDAYRNNYSDPYPFVDSAGALFSQLDPKHAMVIPHMHRFDDWDSHDPQFEPVVEIYSCWGNREYPGCRHATTNRIMEDQTVQAVLARGYKLGFVGGADGHGGRPGNDYWLRVRGAQPSGITAVFAKELTRESIWNAIRHRRCYATTGKRIIVTFHLNGAMMGSEVNLSNSRAERCLDVCVYGTDRIERVTIIKNNRDIETRTPECEDVVFKWIDKTPAEDGDYYYLRIEQADGAMAWASPIWIAIEH
jgi:hypothetical protein